MPDIMADNLEKSGHQPWAENLKPFTDRIKHSNKSVAEQSSLLFFHEWIGQNFPEIQPNQKRAKEVRKKFGMFARLRIDGRHL